jgi:hypothetical protein
MCQIMPKLRQGMRCHGKVDEIDRSEEITVKETVAAPPKSQDCKVVSNAGDKLGNSTD